MTILHTQSHIFFIQGITRFLLGGSEMISTMLSLMEHGLPKRNLGLQIMVVFKLTTDSDTCVSQCRKRKKKRMLHIKSEVLGQAPFCDCLLLKFQYTT